MDLQQMAQEAGFFVHPRKGGIRSPHDFSGDYITEKMEKFADMVAAAEREACAKVCDDIWDRAEGAEAYGADQCGKAIRMRSNIV